jgi:methylisocitrate lyase
LIEGACRIIVSGVLFRNALASDKPLLIVGNQCLRSLQAKKAGFRAIYLSGSGVAAASLGLPDLGITTLDDVLTDVQRITSAVPCLSWWILTPDLAELSRSPDHSLHDPCCAAVVHIEDQCRQKRCGHRPGKAWSVLQRWWIASRLLWMPVQTRIWHHGAH